MEDMDATTGMDDFESLANSASSSNLADTPPASPTTAAQQQQQSRNPPPPLTVSSNNPTNKNRKTPKNPIQEFISWYLELLSKFPIPTKMLTSAFVQFCGSLVAQKLVIKAKKIDWHSVLKFSATGALVSPASHFWFETLDRIMQTIQPTLNSIRKQTGIPAKQIVSLGLDQLVFAPLLNCLFFSWLAIFDKQPQNIPHNIKRDLWPTLTKSWMVWPFASLINLNYVPPQLRVLFGNMVGFFWSIYLSYSLSRK